MYGKLLVPIDGSPESLAAAALARDLIKAGLAGSAILIHVINITHELRDISLLKPTMLHEEAEEMRIDHLGQEILQPARDLFEQADLPVDTLVAWGEPAQEIVKNVQELHIDLIIMGSRGLSAIKGMVMGSVSTKTLHLARCQVIVLKS